MWLSFSDKLVRIYFSRVQGQQRITDKLERKEESDLRPFEETLTEFIIYFFYGVGCECISPKSINV